MHKGLRGNEGGRYKAKQGFLFPELAESEWETLEAQIAQLKDANAKLEAELAKVNERNAVLEAMNRQFMELRHRVTRRIDKAVKEKYGIVNEEALNIALDGLEKFFKRTPNAVM